MREIYTQKERLDVSKVDFLISIIAKHKKQLEIAAINLRRKRLLSTNDCIGKVNPNKLLLLF